MEVFLMGLLVVSTLTGLLTEAIKNLCIEHGWNYYANTLAGIDAVCVSIPVSVGYIICTNTMVTTAVIVEIIALIAGSWLCAMVGYDKVIQAITQFEIYGEDDG